ncbi:hypothetical protein UT300005_31820 [Clostridium sp. CTA-5]
MANKIQIKRGVKSNLPVLNVGEPAFTTDTKEFFIGDGLSNIEFAKQSDLEITNTHLKDIENKVNNIKIVDGTTTNKGIVKLNNATNSTSQTEAATSLAVKVAMDRANEAFQSANNGKTIIANVIGNVSGNNTHAEIANRIQADKNTMANNLNSKGVGANGNEALASLARKIGNIPTTKIASGTGIMKENINLGWRPNVVLIKSYYRNNYAHDVYSCISGTISFEIDMRSSGADLMETKIKLQDSGFIYDRLTGGSKYNTFNYYAIG